MSTTRVAINGFGRIGRCVFKQMYEREGLEVVAINDLADLGDLAYLLKHDSVHGRLDQEIRGSEGHLVIDDDRIPFTSEKDPKALPWTPREVDVVVEATGALRGREQAGGHLAAGAGRVVITAPSDDVDLNVVFGVNHDRIDPERHRLLSAASCTTNCVAPMLHVLHERFGVEWGTFTTVHAYTASQSLTDMPTRKRRRGRAAALNVIPTTTGAAKATERVLPELDGRLDGMAMRVPVPDGSITDLVAGLSRDVSVDEIDAAFREAANGALVDVLGYEDEEIVSQDVIGDPHSCLYDAGQTRLLRDRVVKLLGWYDNEWGYSARVVDLVEHVENAAG